MKYYSVIVICGGENSASFPRKTEEGDEVGERRDWTHMVLSLVVC